MAAPNSIYMRLLDIPAKEMTSEELLTDVKQAVDQLGAFEWLAPPRVHTAGGFEIHLLPLHSVDDTIWTDWICKLDAAGYRNVI